MNAKTNMPKLPVKPKGQRPDYFQDPAIDKVLSIAMALAGEVSVLYERIDTLERALAEKNSVDLEALASFKPDRDVMAERDAWRNRFLQNILRVVHMEHEALKEGGAAYEEHVRASMEL